MPSIILSRILHFKFPGVKKKREKDEFFIAFVRFVKNNNSHLTMLYIFHVIYKSVYLLFFGYSFFFFFVLKLA